MEDSRLAEEKKNEKNTFNDKNRYPPESRKNPELVYMSRESERLFAKESPHVLP